MIASLSLRSSRLAFGYAAFGYAAFDYAAFGYAQAAGRRGVVALRAAGFER